LERCGSQNEVETGGGLMAMIDVMKRIAIEAVSASDPTAIMYGEVTSSNPLEINIDQRFTVTSDLLVVTESLVHFEINLHHKHAYDDSGEEKETEYALPEEPIVIRRGLEVGDKVLLLRVQGGQNYVVMDRLVDA
jgi:hypothetical protein